MGKNGVATTLRVIGGVGAFGGIVLAIAVADEFGGILPIVPLVAGLINCAMFFGFAEIISLLQTAADTQGEILKQLGKGDVSQGKAPMGVLQDIEANLPKM